MNRLLRFFKKENFNIKDFYKKDYSILLDKNTLEITSENSKVIFSIEKEVFTKKEYKLLKKPVKSNIRIAGLYSRYNEKKKRTPKGYTRKILCYGLYLLLDHGRIHLDDIITCEADPSENNNLVNKVYLPMGFEMVAPTSEVITGGLMQSNIRTILSFCNKNFIKEKTKK